MPYRPPVGLTDSRIQRSELYRKSLTMLLRIRERAEGARPRRTLDTRLYRQPSRMPATDLEAVSTAEASHKKVRLQHLGVRSSERARPTGPLVSTSQPTMG